MAEDEATLPFNLVLDVDGSSHRCSKCGKDMADNSGAVTIGARIEVKVIDGVDQTHFKKQLGKYELGKCYQFCWECWLDSMFGVNLK